MAKANLGADHPDTLASMGSLAGYYDRLGDTRRATEMGEECWQMRKAKLGADHPHTLVSMGNLAGYYDRLGEGRRAAEMEERCLRMRDKSQKSLVSLPALSHSDTHRNRKKDGKRAGKLRLFLLDRVSRRWR